MRKGVLIATILALPLPASSEPVAKSDAKVATQLGATLGESEAKRSRALNLSEVKQSKAELPPARASENLRVADPRYLPSGPTSDNKIQNIEKVEAKGARSAYQPVPMGADRVRGARLGKPRRVQLAAFDPAQLRAGTAATTQTDEIVRSWKSNLTWNTITIEGYATPKGHSEAEAQKLAQRSADQVRAYLVRRGVPAEYVVAVGHVEASAPGAKVELSVTTCDGATIACREPTAANSPSRK